MSRQPSENVDLFVQRRKALCRKVHGAAVLVAAPPEAIRNHDVHHPYRQSSSMYYLTGFEEPESILLLRPGMTPESVLFVRRKDPERETWDGFRYGPEAAAELFKFDQCYPIDEFESRSVELLKGVEKLYYRQFQNPEVDEKVQNILQKTSKAQGRTGMGLLPVFDAEELIGEMRLFKSEPELQNLRRACQISAEVHMEAMRYVRPGVNEREINGFLHYQMMKRGAAREGYGAIVAAGNNATTLHYVFNDQPCKAGQLLLIDAGAEYNYFTGDITRTFPVSGKFTDEQAHIYEAVLKVQKTILEMLKPGIAFKDLQDTGTQMLTEAMLELGLLQGRKSDIIEALEHKRYYPHGIGHWLGMDVHDAGLYLVKGQPRLLEEDMCFTIEPGLYIPENDTKAPARYRGIGIRIEDNLRITRDGYENMTSLVPKEIGDIEKLMSH
jgi:Xaa-Pro aminopeptidase